MASRNIKPESIYTHEGGKAKRINFEQQLRRSVMACMLWEDTFYESGTSIAQRIETLCELVDQSKVKKLAIEAKYDMGIRHTPLLMAVAANALNDKEFVKKLIRRPDDMTELLSLYWLKGKKPIPKQTKLAFTEKLNEFDRYQLAKYQKKGKEISLRDIIRLVHPRPKDSLQNENFNGVVNGTITPPDTWETALMQGADKKETFERLINENKLGALAFLRNLRNMKQAGVGNIREGLEQLRVNKILPFQFIQSASYAPDYEDVLEKKMLESVQGFEKLPGKTVLLVDISGSMQSVLAGKSQIQRDKAAGGVAIMIRELCERVSIYAFGTRTYSVPNRRGFALSDLLQSRNEGTMLRQAVNDINAKETYDRIIVITDEQSHDGIGNPKGKGYLINVAAYKNGVGYQNWVHIDGWSPAVIKYIAEYEKS